MKKILFLTAFALGLISLSAQEISFIPEVIDFGVVKLNGKAVSTVSIKNTGDKPLIISKASPSCGCTVPSFTQEPIAPGKSGTITVEYTTTSVAGPFSKTITIHSNAVSEARKTIRVKGDIQ